MNSFDSVIRGELRSRLGGIRASGSGEFECDVDFDPAFRGFEGHFPGHPIVPGVCLTELVRVMFEAAVGHAFRCSEISQCRFRRPVTAGDAVKCRLRVMKREASRVKLNAELTVNGAPACQLRMTLEES